MERSDGEGKGGGDRTTLSRDSHVTSPTNLIGQFSPAGYKARHTQTPARDTDWRI